MLGGARLTNEGAYAWAKLAKAVIGTDSVDAQLGDGLPAELVLSLPRATIDEACAAKVVVLLTGDLREELPVLFLRLREAAREGRDETDRAGPTTQCPHWVGHGVDSGTPRRIAGRSPSAHWRLVRRG